MTVGSMDEFSDDPVLANINVDEIPGNVALTEAVRHQSTRPVSLIELLDAFEEAKRDAEIQIHRQKAREALKLTNEKFDDKAHKEDHGGTWPRPGTGSSESGNGPIGIEDLFNGEKEDRIMVFVALRFLAKYGKIARVAGRPPFGQISWRSSSRGGTSEPSRRPTRPACLPLSRKR